MLKLFQKIKTQPAPPVLPGPVNAILTRWLVRWAGKLQAWTNRLSNGRLRTFLIAGCFCFSLLLLVIIGRSFRQEKATLKVSAITIPAHVTATNLSDRAMAVLSPGEVQAIKRFQAYLDSLKKTKDGRFTLDSIQSARPGLLDSLAFIENYYHQQFQK